MPRSRAAALVMVGSALLAAGGTGLAAPTASAEPGATAPGAPGAPGVVSHFGLARKDCLGTARGKASKTWFTVAGGVLSDVYYPTVDNTEVQTLSTSSPTGGPSPTCTATRRSPWPHSTRAG